MNMAKNRNKTSVATDSGSPLLLSVKDLCVGYDEIQALFDVNLDVSPGSVTALIGPNGAGKTTLLNSILGVVPVTSGSVTFLGEDITRQSVPKSVHRGITLVPEGRELFAGLSVMENLELGRSIASRRSTPTSGMYDRVFDLFPVLKERQRQLAGSLSGGEQQMAAISRALMGEPTLLMLDEPSLGLAPVMVERIVSGIAKVIEDFDMSVIMVEQNIGAAAALADHLVVMNVGRVTSEVDADENGFDMELLTEMYWGKHEA